MSAAQLQAVLDQLAALSAAQAALAKRLYALEKRLAKTAPAATPAP